MCCDAQAGETVVVGREFLIETRVVSRARPRRVLRNAELVRPVSAETYGEFSINSGMHISP